ncbi:hypothetical protein [Chromatocurvus halotolerans]|uniref:Uracil DNA glycosylase superfamily protein n=1 Tax=Chromatocurvus halotolerans TaxID=1132028 RepID=A0A4R2KQS2_9GAMM|nr:hypothetical protein [Chromatocurvus halotolerans]TCO75974.1 hypothetical protein EV688_106165 [Chromatocurvus halotolerans]
MPSEHLMAHRQTLQAMGLTLYVARYPLPGAATSLGFEESPASVGAGAAPLRQGIESAHHGTDGEALDRSAQEPPDAQALQASVTAPSLLDAASLNVAPVKPTPRPRQATAVDAPALAPFTLAAVALGGRLWLEELPDGVLGRDQVQLVRAICHALGWPLEPLTINQFTWPMHRNPQFDQSADAAKAALSAFVGRQMEAGQCSQLMLLGSEARDRLGDMPPGTPVLCTHSTRDMLGNPQLKRDAWRDLRGQ